MFDRWHGYVQYRYLDGLLCAGLTSNKSTATLDNGDQTVLNKNGISAGLGVGEG